MGIDRLAPLTHAFAPEPNGLETRENWARHLSDTNVASFPGLCSTPGVGLAANLAVGRGQAEAAPSGEKFP